MLLTIKVVDFIYHVHIVYTQHFLDAISISTVGCVTHVTLRFFDVERV